VTVVNLNKARKLRQRAESKATAASNRVKHGRPLPERKKQAAQAELERQRLEQLRRDPA
jgi:hypothetical protein